MALRYEALEISGPPSVLDLAVARLMEQGCLGTEEVSEGHLHAFFSAEVNVAGLVLELTRTISGVSARGLPPVEQRDWLAEWKASFTGFALGEGFFVLPTWKPRPEIERFLLSIDPEQAFGTGAHDTTRLAATLLERYVRAGESVIDLGAGTGILAMIATHLGARPVTAIELDPEAAACARRNLAQNGLESLVRVETAGVEEYDRLAADLLVANITAAVLERSLPRVTVRRAILSGLLVEEVDAFIAGLPDPFRLREAWSAGDWAALVLDTADAT